MASTFSTNKSIEKPANGDYVNTWNVPVNADWDIIDAALGGTTSLVVTGVTATPVVLTSTQYRPLILAISGVLTANVTYQIPSGVGGQWAVKNTTTGAFTVAIASLGGGASVAVTQGYNTQITCDGTNVALASTTPSGAAGSNTQIIYNNSGALAGSAFLTLASGLNLVGIPLNGSQGTNITAAGTINLTMATGSYVAVVGNTGITAITLAEGYQRVTKFTGTPILTNSASLILPGSVNITAAPGDVAIWQGEAAGVARCISYTRAVGTRVSTIYSFDAAAPIAGTYTLDGYAIAPYTINSIAWGNGGSGAMTVAVQIAGVNVTGLSAVSVNAASGTTNASGANAVAAGQRVTFVVSASPTAAAGSFVQMAGTLN